MTTKESNKSALRVILAGAAVLILCSALCGAAAADQGPFPDSGILENGIYILTDNVALANNLTVPDGVTCTINLAGYVLEGTGIGPVITIKGTGNLTLIDENADHSPATTAHYFTFVSNDRWTLDTVIPATSVDLAKFDIAAAIAAGKGNYHVKVTGGVITGGKDNDDGGGGVRVGNAAGGTSMFTMNGGNIVGNSAILKGGGVDVIYGSTFTMNGGNVIGNSASMGGGVNVEDDKTSATMNGGKIIGNNALYGGGVSVSSSTEETSDRRTFTMNDGNITGNNAFFGGGVYVEGGHIHRFIINGGKITGNVAIEDKDYKGDGGGVYVKPAGKFAVSGNCVIKDNRKGTSANNVYLNEKIIIIGSMDGDAEIGITYPLDAGDQFAQAGAGYSITDADAACFFPDHGFCKAEVTDSGAGLKWNGTVSPLIIFNGTEYNLADDSSVAAFNAALGSDADYNKTTNTLTLRDTLNLTSSFIISVPKSGTPFTIDLNGQIMQGNGSTPVIIISKDAELVVTDSNSENTYHFFRVVDMNSQWKLADNISQEEKDKATPLERVTDTSQLKPGTIIRVNGGVITGGAKFTGGGGGVRVGNDSGDKSMFTMNGGNIAGNFAVLGGGGGVDVIYGSTFIMNSGNIAGNSALYGGGVNVEDDNTSATMNGGKIIGNNASYGGGVSVLHGSGAPDIKTFTLNDGTIAGNSALFGGGVYVLYDKSVFTMENGTISGNGAYCGGGVYVEDNGKFILSGGKISENLAVVSEEDDGGFGGGAYVDTEGILTMSEGSITKNTAEREGGGIYVNDDSECALSGGSITENTAEFDGGGVYVDADGELKVSGSPVIKGNMHNNTANNLVLGAEGDEELEFILAGPFSGDVRITSVYGKAPVKGEQFGTAEKDASGAKNITADGSSLFGSISGEKLIWTAKKSSSSQGTSIWLTATQTPEPTPTATPTPTPVPTPEMPTVKPTAYPTPTPASPAPFLGILAGLGCAAVVFGLRRK